MQDSLPFFKIRTNLIKINRISKQIPEDFFPNTFSQSAKKRSISVGAQKYSSIISIEQKASKQSMKEIIQISPEGFRWRRGNNLKYIAGKHSNIYLTHQGGQPNQIYLNNAFINKQNQINKEKNTTSITRDKNSTSKYMQNYCQVMKNKMNIKLKLQLQIEDNINENFIERRPKIISNGQMGNARLVRSQRKSRQSIQSFQKTVCANKEIRQFIINECSRSTSKEKVRKIKFSLKDLPRDSGRHQKQQGKKQRDRNENTACMNVGFDGMLTFCWQMVFKPNSHSFNN